LFPSAPDGKSTGGRRECIEPLARAAFAAGADGLFFETHPQPEQALSDGPNAMPLEHAGAFIRHCVEFRALSLRLPLLVRTEAGI